MASTNEDVVVLATAPSPDGEQLLICAICRIGEPLRSAGGLKRAERCPAHTLTDGEMNFLGLGIASSMIFIELFPYCRA